MIESPVAFVSRAMTHLVSANPLLRRSDRFEAMAVVLAAAVALLAIPVVMMVAAGIHAERLDEISHRAQTLRTVDAVALSNSATPVRPGPQVSVQVEWSEGTSTRVEMVRVSKTVNAGDTVPVWLTADGRTTAPPAEPADAMGEAIIAALAMYCLIGGMAALGVFLVREALDFRRDRDWDVEIKHLMDNDGGWANRHS